MVYLRFYEELNRFLPKQHRKTTIELSCLFSRSVKDLIESLGVPHVEVDLILVNGKSVDFTYTVNDFDRISVYPVFEGLDITGINRLRPEPLRDPRFITDVHLKTLTRKLRMLGFDTLYNPEWDDPQLAQIAEAEQRILLTRDTGLLKRKIVSRGIAISSGNPTEQVQQVLHRLDLYRKMHPFSRCIYCNGSLEKQTLPADGTGSFPIPADIRKEHSMLSVCTGCGRVYWPGSHYTSMKKEIPRLTDIKTGTE